MDVSKAVNLSASLKICPTSSGAHCNDPFIKAHDALTGGTMLFNKNTTCLCSRSLPFKFVLSSHICVPQSETNVDKFDDRRGIT